MLRSDANRFQMNNKQFSAIVVVGPTAIGKTSLAIEIAKEYSCEIISVDSMQVYRYMDIGTAKPTRVEQEAVPHHLIDVADPDDNYTVARFVTEAEKAIESTRERGRIPLLVGGTGLYLKGLLQGLFEIPPVDPSIREKIKCRLKEKGVNKLYEELKEIDPQTASRLHPHDTQRVLRGIEIYHSTGTPWSEHIVEQNKRKTSGSVLKFGLTCDREVLYERINQRVEVMVQQGLVDEVEALLKMGYHGNLKSMQSIGYRHILKYLEGSWDWEKTLTLLARDTRHYAKRQYTWFNSDPEILWVQPDQIDEIKAHINENINRLQ